MNQTALPLESDQRSALIGHIVRRLNTLDDQALLHLAEAAREPAAQPEAVADDIEQTVSRRRFMVALLGGGVLATTAGAVAAWQWGAQQGDALSAKVEQLLSLLGLYKQLDQVPIDSSALSGLEIVGSALSLTSDAAGLVRDGAQAVEDALRRFEESFPKIRDSLAWLEGVVKGLSDQLRLLEDAIGRTLDEVSPITQALGAFFDSLLKLLPFGIGEKAREVMDRIGELITGIPQMIEGINLNILTPLRQEWFSDEKDKGLKGWLIEPLITRLLDPLEALMDTIANLNTSWNKDLDQPIKDAVKQRAALREQIVQYEARYHLQEALAQTRARRILDA